MHTGARRGMTAIEIVSSLVILAIIVGIGIANFTAPTIIAVARPDSLTTSAGSGTLSVKVAARTGNPQPGVTVVFESQGSGGVTPTDALTDSTGIASARWRAGPDTGMLRITARAAGRSRPTVVFSSHVAGVPAAK